jgi:putative ATP-dependent endonuclease of OLD family
MKFAHLEISNFRNFEHVDINLSNKNIIFGLNDIGKSNFLAALRFLLDRTYRKDGFIDSDFYIKELTREIQITLTIKVTDDEDDEDSKKIFKMMKGAVDSKSTEIYIQLKSTFDDSKSIGEPRLYWGIDLSNLEEIPSRQSYFELDRHINIVYIDSSIKLESAFKKYSRDIFRKESSINLDEREELKVKIDSLNDCVGKLNTVKSLKGELTGEYKKFRDEKDFSLEIMSEIEMGNLHDKLTPYILDVDKKTYPTSGDGRKKILAYTLLTLESRKKEDSMINIFLIEELENHLHRSMQKSISHEIFSDELFEYLFLTTHSSLIVSQMDEVNLVKLVKGSGVVGKSILYSVPNEYKTLKYKLNQNLAEAIYADVVLLVEGPSEKILFERILFDKCENYEGYGGYILEVDGINFIEYYRVLNALGINVIVRTDNDLKYNKDKNELNLLGINRCYSLIGNSKLANTSLEPEFIENYVSNSNCRVNTKRYLFDHNLMHIKRLIDSNIFLSRVDLENDLDDIIHDKLDTIASINNSEKTGVDYLQSAKLKNMIKLCVKLSENEITQIYEHDRFECIRKMVELCCQ